MLDNWLQFFSGAVDENSSMRDLFDVVSFIMSLEIMVLLAIFSGVVTSSSDEETWVLKRKININTFYLEA